MAINSETLTPARTMLPVIGASILGAAIKGEWCCE